MTTPPDREPAKQAGATDQTRIDQALEAQHDENLAWAEAFAEPTARIWSHIEW